ncbi:CD209 antigen-like protein E isoform X1 [Myxocyprinus asiaticus]|uniref:CD209 antigen-like protein E isoform X1 n=1 Tax=Myxocyprinus asiaticus TaxID=70543 RepID=UPI002222E998|nr:CD209 antigen-like protein E isoform X1 [Myxocyprinus asiaticus]XP_051576550.1 CD209 antigen-like protein E isoform X1 [Myxocyprinus asiaticus]
MEDIENYTSLQEFTEDLSHCGNRPILNTLQDKKGVHKGTKCLRGQAPLVLSIALLASVFANIVLGVLLVNSRKASPTALPAKNDESEAASLTLKLTAMQERFSRLCSEYTTLGQTCSKQVIQCRPCPETWMHMEGMCYFFSEDKLDWEHSKESCASMGGHLTILHSYEQHHTLESVARQRGGPDYHFWIGLSDTETEGVWKWVDNTVVNRTFWNEWHKEPNNHQSGGIHGEDCAVLDSHSKTWFDVPCDFNYKRICEMDPITIDM